LASSPLATSVELDPEIVEDVVMADQSAIYTNSTTNASHYESKAVAATPLEPVVPVEPLVAPTATMMPPPRPTAEAQSSGLTHEEGPPQEEETKEVPSFRQNYDSAMATENRPESAIVPETSHAPIHPHPQPWPAADSGTETTTPPSIEPSGLHVQMPPVPNFVNHRSTTPSLVDTPSPLTGTSFAQSPVANAVSQASFFPPSVAAAIAPSPLKKKMSLSDYTRKKAKATGTSNRSASNDPPSLHDGANEATENGSDALLPTLQYSTSSVLEEVDMPLAPLSQGSAETPAAEAEPTVTSSVG